VDRKESAAWYHLEMLDEDVVGIGMRGGYPCVKPWKRRVALFYGEVCSGDSGRSRSDGSYSAEAPWGAMNANEEKILHAVYKAGGLPPCDDLKKLHSNIGTFRSACLEPGELALLNMLSLDVLFRSSNPWETDPHGFHLASLVNKYLPENVRVFGIQRVRKSYRANCSTLMKVFHYYVPPALFGVQGSSDQDDGIVIQINEYLRILTQSDMFAKYCAHKLEEMEYGGRLGPAYQGVFNFGAVCDGTVRLRHDGPECLMLRFEGLNFWRRQIRTIVPVLLKLRHENVSVSNASGYFDRYFSENLNAKNLPLAPPNTLLLEHVREMHPQNPKPHEQVYRLRINQSMRDAIEHFGLTQVVPNIEASLAKPETWKISPEVF